MKYRTRNAALICGPLLALVLSGCVARFQKAMNTDLQRFVGQDVHVAIRRLGYPASTDTIAGDHLYRWAAASARGLGVNPDVGGCRIDLVVDGSLVVRRFSWEGSRRACGEYQERLEAD